eukprot:GHVL01013064.1.p1 GENE.GHVL01013064.1~~GHVL01013064.1.p1  ORF type:complete len:1008 (-),score=368.04 GHVL01013064.1:1406-4324(-)
MISLWNKMQLELLRGRENRVESHWQSIINEIWQTCSIITPDINVDPVNETVKDTVNETVKDTVNETADDLITGKWDNMPLGPRSVNILDRPGPGHVLIEHFGKLWIELIKILIGFDIRWLTPVTDMDDHDWSLFVDSTQYLHSILSSVTFLGDHLLAINADLLQYPNCVKIFINNLNKIIDMGIKNDYKKNLHNQSVNRLNQLHDYLNMKPSNTVLNIINNGYGLGINEMWIGSNINNLTRYREEYNKLPQIPLNLIQLTSFPCKPLHMRNPMMNNFRYNIPESEYIHNNFYKVNRHMCGEKIASQRYLSIKDMDENCFESQIYYESIKRLKNKKKELKNIINNNITNKTSDNVETDDWREMKVDSINKNMGSTECVTEDTECVTDDLLGINNQENGYISVKDILKPSEFAPIIYRLPRIDNQWDVRYMTNETVNCNGLCTSPLGWYGRSIIKNATSDVNEYKFFEKIRLRYRETRIRIITEHSQRWKNGLQKLIISTARRAYHMLDKQKKNNESNVDLKKIEKRMKLCQDGFSYSKISFMKSKIFDFLSQYDENNNKSTNETDETANETDETVETALKFCKNYSGKKLGEKEFETAERLLVDLIWKKKDGKNHRINKMREKYLKYIMKYWNDNNFLLNKTNVLMEDIDDKIETVDRNEADDKNETDIHIETDDKNETDIHSKTDVKNETDTYSKTDDKNKTDTYSKTDDSEISKILTICSDLKNDENIIEKTELIRRWRSETANSNKVIKKWIKNKDMKLPVYPMKPLFKDTLLGKNESIIRILNNFCNSNLKDEIMNSRNENWAKIQIFNICQEARRVGNDFKTGVVDDSDEDNEVSSDTSFEDTPKGDVGETPKGDVGSLVKRRLLKGIDILEKTDGHGERWQQLKDEGVNDDLSGGQVFGDVSDDLIAAPGVGYITAKKRFQMSQSVDIWFLDPMGVNGSDDLISHQTTPLWKLNLQNYPEFRQNTNR